MSSLDNQQSLDQSKSERHELKAKIIRFQTHQQSFKHFMKQINHALTYPNQYEKITFEVLLQRQTSQLNKLKLAFQSLKSVNRRPYVQLMNQYEASLKQHQELIKILDDQDLFLQKIKQSHQINIQFLEQYKQTLTWQYLLRGIMALAGAFMVHVIIGASSRWNFLNVYATSFYKVTVNPYLVVVEDSYASPLSLFCMGLGMRIGMRLQQAIGTLYSAFLSISAASFCIYVSAYMPNFQLFVFFSFALYPFFSSLAFHSVINECYHYYPKRRLLINGVIIVGTGLGHIFFGLFNTQCINPEDVPSVGGYFGGQLDYIAREVPYCMKQMGLMVALMGLLSLVLLYPAISYNNRIQNQNKHNRAKLDFQYACASERQALGSKIFWLFILIIMLTTSGNYFFNSNFKNLISKYQKNTLKLAGVLMAFNFSNSSSRALWAFVFTKLGLKYCMILITILNAFTLSTINFVMQYQDIYFVYFVISGACLGGCMVCFFNFTTLVFGQYVGQQLPGYVWTCYSLANLLQYVLVNALDVSTNGYTWVLQILAIFNLVSLVIVIRSKLQGDWQNNLNYLQLRCYFK